MTGRDAADELLFQSLTLRAREMRASESRARRAYSVPGPLRDASLRLAELYRQAAELFENEISESGLVVAGAPGTTVLDEMNRGRAAVGMPPLTLEALPPAPPAELVIQAPTTETARCWSGAPIYCKQCAGKTTALEDECGSLADGGSYERFKCNDCRATTYVQLPD